MKQTSAPDLSGIRARLAAASAGPWSYELEHWDCALPHTVSSDPAFGPGAWAHVGEPGDAVLFAHAADDIAFLLTMVERLTILLTAATARTVEVAP